MNTVKILIIFCQFLFCSSIAFESKGFQSQFVFWNVGQGQWSSWVTAKMCWHFDIGGERAPWNQITELCRGKINKVSLSHWDLDHISQIQRARLRLGRLCLAARPFGKSSARKKKLLQNISDCAEDPADVAVKEITPAEKILNPRNSNETSRVFIVKNQFLLPGDSPQKKENIWLKQIGAKSKISILALGHHGSNSSTGKLLLASLPNLQMAIASARFAKYGHPHPKLRFRLRQAHCALLQTEVWGNLHFQLKDRDRDDIPFSNHEPPARNK